MVDYKMIWRAFYVSFFLKAQYSKREITKDSVEIEYKFTTRWLNPINWLMIPFIFIFSGVSGLIDTFQKSDLGDWTHQKWTWKNNTNWFLKKYDYWLIVYGMKDE